MFVAVFSGVMAGIVVMKVPACFLLCLIVGFTAGDQEDSDCAHLQALNEESDNCWETHMRDEIEELRGLNDTESIRAVMVKFCSTAGEIHDCLAGLNVRGTACLGAEERAKLRLHSLYKETVMSVRCQNDALLDTRMRLGKLRITTPSAYVHGDDVVEHCYSRENKDLGVAGQGVNEEMLREYSYLQAVVACFNKAKMEGQEDAVSAGIAMATAILDHIKCIRPMDGKVVLCKTIADN